jgi:hypothetical protein
MATTTPNFGWAVPTSTDLVKDGAVAIETLGDSIDASLVDLKGGTTGQVLAKASNTDMDFSWVAQDDSNAIQNSIVDAKGDIIAATANDTPARLAVGANNTVLTADSSTATGLKWATPSAGSSFSGALIARATGQSINNTTFTAISFETEFFDSGTYWSSGSPTRLTVPTTGKYQYNFQASISGTTGRLIVEVRKNGSSTAQFECGNNSSLQGWQASQIKDATANDYFEFFVYQGSGSTQSTDGGNLSVQASIVFLGA